MNTVTPFSKMVLLALIPFSWWKLCQLSPRKWSGKAFSELIISCQKAYSLKNIKDQLCPFCLCSLAKVTTRGSSEQFRWLKYSVIVGNENLKSWGFQRNIFPPWSSQTNDLSRSASMESTTDKPLPRKSLKHITIAWKSSPSQALATLGALSQ